MVGNSLLRFGMLLAGVTSVAGGADAAGDTGRRPNIVLILADDMGYSDIGCFGSEIATPNLDRLALGGVRFTQMRNAARCSPSRASLLTGLHPHQAGMGLNASTPVDVPAYQGFLSENSVTIPEVLRTAGYRTSLSGKWHLGDKRPYWPRDRGFDEFFGLIEGSASYWKPKRLVRDDKEVQPGEDFYMTDAITDDVVRFIGSVKKGQPFFTYVSYTAPHWPLHARPADIAKYEGRYSQGWDAIREERYQKLIKLGILNSGQPMSPPDPQVPAWDSLTKEQQADAATRMAIYAAQVDSMDQGIGKILEAIEEKGETDNTLVIFLSDNGGDSAELHKKQKPGVAPGSEGSFLSYGRPWASVSNTPYRLFKSWVHEGGISTPMIAYWPNGVKTPGEISRHFCHLVDIMPTFVKAAGATYPTEFRGHAILPMEGQSLLPILEGQTPAAHDLIGWEHEGRQALRKGNWKAVTRESGTGWELYDLANDPMETNDLASSSPAKLKELVADYETWAARTKIAPFETIKARVDENKKAAQPAAAKQSP